MNKGRKPARKSWRSARAIGAPSRRAQDSPTLSILTILLVFAVSACGYSFSARTNPHLKTIAVPIFQNKTLEKGVEQRLADGVADAFLADKSLRVVEEKDADSVILGTIERYDRSPYSYDKSQAVQEYKVELVLRVGYEDRTKNKVIWEETALRAWGTYSVSSALAGGIEEEIVAQDRAIEKAAQDILIKTVRGW
ncbi:MAG: LPS assembly lipoprotein LptE [bacterium]